MKREELKPGMVFKENDKRFDRWIWILKVTPYEILLGSGPSPKSTLFNKTRSNKPERFHREKRSSGYTLVSE